MRIEQQYIDLFAQTKELINTRSADVLNVHRVTAFANFERLGFPTKKQEASKYTDVSRFFEPDYGLNLNRLNIPVNPYEVFHCDVPNMSTSLYFVVNDAFYDKLPPKATLPEGVIFGSLKEVAKTNPELISKYYGKLADTSKDGVTAFNTSFAQDGVFFYVPKNVVVDRPIQLVNILRSDVDFLVNRRVLIVLEEGAQAKLLACDHAMDDVNFLATQVIEVFVGENATFDLYELEETTLNSVRLSNLYVEQAASSNVLLNGVTLYNGTTRNTVRVTLAGEHAETNVCGMVIADKNQHVDNNTFIDHAVPNCNSNELFKYVLDEQAVGAFAGTVLVRPGAQHTNSQQTNRNLCATREARMYTQPQLEIYADDVKCSHGATVGQLDENALFYMRSRGIEEKEARLLLMFAFVNEVVDTIRLDALKDRLHLLVEKRFRGELARCQGCGLTPTLSKEEGEGKIDLTNSNNERACTCKKKI
ncbi:Fe-S cluster assembly protein SufD [Bacteroides sp. 214]|nr:Fe-S cluster assembly protein SufD [Bacteroides sp. 214]